mmetsp:Transcript_115682/g.323507  ORF Transcript_115682/g.323507 Transcript_115682/m.323507 type:complete len:446 (+) Transcript_115682:1-1338(+)
MGPPHEDGSHSWEAPAQKMLRKTLTARLAPPPTEPLWRRIIRDKEMLATALDTIVSLAIVLNFVVVYVQLEFVGCQAGAKVGAEGFVGERCPESEDAFKAFSILFAACFLAELVTKLCVWRWSLFYDEGSLQKFNIFDTLIVLVTILDAVMSTTQEEEFGGSGLMFLRVLRFIRCFRALRAVRTFHMFSKLRVLLATVTASFFALFWSMVLLGLMMLIASLFLCQTIQSVMFEPSVDEATREWLFRYYGTPSRSLWTFFELTFSGGWPTYARRLVEDVSSVYAFFFVLYIACVTFATFRIITALFLRDTLCVATADTELMIQEKIREKESYAQKLRFFFEVADTNGDGVLTREEFEDVLKDEHIKSYLAILELDGGAGDHLFEMLVDGGHRVTSEEFVRIAMRLKGSARSQDVVSIRFDCARMHKKLEEMSLVLKALESRGAPRP